jgi:hypothetical protein
LWSGRQDAAGCGRQDARRYKSAALQNCSCDSDVTRVVGRDVDDGVIVERVELMVAMTALGPDEVLCIAIVQSGIASRAAPTQSMPSTMRADATMKKSCPHRKRQENTRKHHGMANGNRSHHTQKHGVKPIETPPIVNDVKDEWSHRHRKTEGKTASLTKTPKP